MEKRCQIHVPGIVQRESRLWVPSTLTAGGQASPLASTEALPDRTLIVVGEPPNDLDVMFVAPDPEALGQQTPPLRDICETLSIVPVDAAVIGLSAIAAASWHAGTNQARQLKLAEEVFRGRPVLDLLRRFVAEDRHHTVFSDQHLTILLRLLLQHGRNGDARTDMTDDEVDALLTAMIAVTGLTGRLSDPEDTGQEPMGWVPWLLRSGLYFDKSNLGSDQGRARALFVDLAQEADPDGDSWLDLATWAVEDVAGVVEQFGFGYAMGGFARAFDSDLPAGERFIGIKLDGLLAANMSSEQVERLVAASSATRVEFEQQFQQHNDVDHLLWDRTPFEKRPFFRLGDGRLVLLNPRFLHSWMGEGVYYRMLDSAIRRPDPRRPKKPATLRFTQFHGELMERYVQRVAERSHAEQLRAGVVRISGEQKYVGHRKTEQKTPDLVLDYASDLVTIEVTGGRPSRRTRILSDPALMKKELDDRVIGKLKELDKALKDIVAGIAPIPRLDLALVERIWPIVVVPSAIIQSDVLWNYVDERVPGLFTHHRALQPPTLFSIEDYERAMAVVETGQGLPAVLAARMDSPYRRMPPSHFFERYFRHVGRPRYVDEQLRLVGDEARAALGFRDGGADDRLRSPRER